VREEPDARHVTDRPDVFGGTQPLVDHDARPCDLDAELLEPETFDVRPAPGGDHEVGRLERPAPLDLQAVAARASVHLRRASVEAEVDPLLTEELAEQIARVAVDARQEVVPALDDRHVRADARVELRQLAAHGPSTDHDEARGDLVRARPLAARPRADGVQPLDRGHRRERAR